MFDYSNIISELRKDGYYRERMPVNSPQDRYVVIKNKKVRMNQRKQHIQHKRNKHKEQPNKRNQHKTQQKQKTEQTQTTPRFS